MAVGCFHGIVRSSQGFGPYRFDLDAPERFFDADDEVVTFTISPRLGNGVSATGGFSHEGELGKFAAMLIVEGCVRRFGRLCFFGDRQRGPKR